MNILKTTILAAAAYGAYKLLTERDILTGRTKAEELRDQFQTWLEEAKDIKTNIQTEFEEFTDMSPIDKRAGKKNAIVDPTL